MHFFVKIKQWILRNSVKIFVTAILTFALVFVASTLPPNSDQLAIRKVCFQALLAEQTLSVPRNLATISKLTISANSVQTTDTTPISDAVEQQMDTLVATTYQQYYTGPLLQQKIQTGKDAIHHYKTGNTRFLGGGVDSMTFTNISINGNTAIAKASAVVWTIVAQDQGNGKIVPAHPRGTILLTYTLTKQQGQWYINSQQWLFAPGEEP